MANHQRNRCRAVRSAPVQQPAGTAPAEPVMRRWPHPVEGTELVSRTDPTLHYIHCALSYQNQLLADIKTLLQQLAAEKDAEA